MRTTNNSMIPVISLITVAATAFLTESALPYTHLFATYRFAIAIVVIYVFFHFIAFADKRRAAQLDDVGLLRPLHDGAFLICVHAHLRNLGISLTWLSDHMSIEIGLLSWCCILMGLYAPIQPQGLPNKLLNALPFVEDHNKHILYKGVVISGAIGVAGTFTATLQPIWLLIPLLFTFWKTARATP